jgi:hypothetical protein
MGKGDRCIRLLKVLGGINQLAAMLNADWVYGFEFKQQRQKLLD